MKEFTNVMEEATKENPDLSLEDNKKLKVMADLGIFDTSDESVFISNFLQCSNRNSYQLNNNAVYPLKK